MRHEEVAHADRLGETALLDLLHGAPGIEATTCDGPVNEVEIDVREPKSLETCVERSPRLVIPVVVVPELRRDEDPIPGHPTLPHANADVGLVAVDACGIDVAITQTDRGGHRSPSDLTCGRLPHPEPNLR